MKSPDENTANTSLARIMEKICFKLGIDKVKKSYLIDKWLSRVHGGKDVEKIPHHHKTNAMREFNKSTLTFPKLIDFFNIVEFKKVEVIYRCIDKNGKLIEVTETLDFLDETPLERHIRFLEEDGSYTTITEKRKEPIQAPGDNESETSTDDENK